MTAQEICGCLTGVKAAGKGFIACCPSHEDHTPSLSISTGDDGRVLLHCHSGCTLEAICAALKIQPKDLFSTPLKSTVKERIVAEYDYTDEDGKLLFQVVRYEPKGFKQRAPKANGGWDWSTKGVRKPLYRLPQVQAAINRGLPVVVVEGEKDVEALESHGYTATTNPGGAASEGSKHKWLDEHTVSLTGADVYIMGDNDEKGQEHVQMVAAKLHGRAKSVRVVTVPQVPNNLKLPVKDAADFFAANGTMADLQTAIDAAPVWQPKDESATDDGLPDIVASDELIELDLPTPPELVEGIVHQGSKVMFGGGSKIGKTWLLADLGISIASGTPFLGHATTQGKVLYVNFETQQPFFSKRLNAIYRAKGIPPSPNLKVWTLRGHATAYQTLLPKLQKRIHGAGYSIVIVDPTYKMLGEADENSAGDIAKLQNGIEAITVSTGAAVAQAAHFAKGNSAGKDVLDRISGSGVFARDPDTFLTFTEHETPGAFSVEMRLRNFAPVEPFVVTWNYPVFTRCYLDPSKLKQKGGRTKEHDPLKLLAAIADTTVEKPISISAWAVKAGIVRTTLLEYTPGMRSKGWIATVGEGAKARQHITQKGKDALNSEPLSDCREPISDSFRQAA